MALPTREETIPGDYAKSSQVVYHNGGTYYLNAEDDIVSGFRGFVIEKGLKPEDDTVLSAMPTVTLQHTGQGGKPKRVDYWNLGREIKFFPLFAGLVGANVSAMGKRGKEQAERGIVAGWFPVYGKTDQNESRVALLGILPVKNDSGIYPLVVQFGLKGKSSDFLVKALLAHLHTTAALDAIKNYKVFPAEVLLTLYSGKEQVPFTSKSGETKMVNPVLHKHPEKSEVTAAWLKENKIYRPDSFLPAIEAGWDTAVSWATEYYTALTTKSGAPAAPAVEYEDEEPAYAGSSMLDDDDGI